MTDNQLCQHLIQCIRSAYDIEEAPVLLQQVHELCTEEELWELYQTIQHELRMRIQKKQKKQRICTIS